MSGYESQRPEEDPYALPADMRKRKEQRREDFDAERDLMPYQIVLSGKAIRLEQVEYRLLVFLSKKPYHAFSMRQILKGINVPHEPQVTDESLRELVRSLRDKLGFFWDFIQYVPNFGYRFKP